MMCAIIFKLLFEQGRDCALPVGLCLEKRVGEQGKMPSALGAKVDMHTCIIFKLTQTKGVYLINKDKIFFLAD